MSNGLKENLLVDISAMFSEAEIMTCTSSNVRADYSNKTV